MKPSGAFGSIWKSRASFAFLQSTRSSLVDPTEGALRSRRLSGTLEKQNGVP